MSELQVILLCAQIFATVEPFAMQGLHEFVQELQKLHQQGAKPGMPELKALAEEVGVDIETLFSFGQRTAAVMACAEPLPSSDKMELSFSNIFSDIGSFFTQVRNWFADPQTAAAIKNVETIAVALVCELATAASLAEAVMQEVNADPSTEGTTKKIYVASQTICTALNGTLTGQQASNVAAVTQAG